MSAFPVDVDSTTKQTLIQRCPWLRGILKGEKVLISIALPDTT